MCICVRSKHNLSIFVYAWISNMHECLHYMLKQWRTFINFILIEIQTKAVWRVFSPDFKYAMLPPVPVAVLLHNSIQLWPPGSGSTVHVWMFESHSVFWSQTLWSGSSSPHFCLSGCKFRGSTIRVEARDTDKGAHSHRYTLKYSVKMHKANCRAEEEEKMNYYWQHELQHPSISSELIQDADQYQHHQQLDISEFYGLLHATKVN